MSGRAYEVLRYKGSYCDCRKLRRIQDSMERILCEFGSLLDEFRQVAGDSIYESYSGSVSEWFASRLFSEKPVWDREARQLSWNALLARKVKRPIQACNVVEVLNAFEAK